MKVEDIKGEVKKKAAKAADKAGTMYEIGKERLSHVEFRPMWERIKTGFGKTATIIGKGTEKAAESVVLTAKRAGIQYERYELHRKLQKLVAQLGAAVYDAWRKGEKTISYSAPPVKDLLEKIEGLEKQIDAVERKSRSLKKAA